MKKINLAILLLLGLPLMGCGANSSTHGTEKEIAIKVTITNHSGGFLNISSPLDLVTESATEQDTANQATATPTATARLQLTEGGATAAGDASTLKDIISRFDPDQSRVDSDNIITPAPAPAQVATIPPGLIKPVDPTLPMAVPEIVKPVPTGDVPVIVNDKPPIKQEATGTVGATKTILWKPVAEKDTRLVVLLPSNFGSPEIFITDINGTVIEKGIFTGLSNPNRATYRFSKTGKIYPSPCLLKIGNNFYLVKDTGKRSESLPIYVR